MEKMENNAQQTEITEIWRQYLDTKYEVSNLGNVRNKKTKAKKNEFDCINPRICFPSVISDIKYMSDIYTQNLNYQNVLST